VKPTEIIDRTPAGAGTELVLYQRDGCYHIRVNGLELMSSRAHASERELARLVYDELPAGASRVLIGGLGMGYTLRAALDLLAPGTEVVVVEVFPAVVRWCQGPLAHLANAPLEDPRVTVVVDDVAEVIKAPGPKFDGVLLDVDNGPEPLTLEQNRQLYSRRGLETLVRALTPNGVVGFWSADPDERFARRLAQAGVAVHSVSVSARGNGRGPWHTIILGKAGKQSSRRSSPAGWVRRRKR